MKPFRTKRDDLMDVVAFSAWAYGVTEDAIMSRCRWPIVSAARQAAMRTVTIAFPEMNKCAVARFFGRDHATVFHAMGRRREAPPAVEKYEFSDAADGVTPTEIAVLKHVATAGPTPASGLKTVVLRRAGILVGDKAIAGIVAGLNRKLRPTGAKIVRNGRHFEIGEWSRPKANQVLALAEGRYVEWRLPTDQPNATSNPPNE